MIKIEGLSKRFKKIKALNNINVQFRKGQSVAIIGPNASGKTTLIKSILGMVKPDAGDIIFDGSNIKENRKYLSRIGYMPQIGRYPDHIQVAEVFQLMKSIRNRFDQPSLDKNLYEQFDLNRIAKQTIQTLSGGTRQKVSAALAFLFCPEVLILDEPTAGLDPISSEILKDQIKEARTNGRLILITSHILSDLEDICTDVLYLQEGAVKFALPVTELQSITGELRLSRAIATIMKKNVREWEHL